MGLVVSPLQASGLHWWVIPLCLARVKRGLTRSGTPPDHNILGLPLGIRMLWALVRSSLPMRKIFPLVIGAHNFSHLTSSMLLRWFSFLRRPLRMVSASLCTISSSASFSTSTYAQPSFPPTSRASWLASSLF